jgi:hypothetical protein
MPPPKSRGLAAALDLRCAVAFLRTADDPAVRRVAQGFSYYLNHARHGASLDQSLGVSAPGTPWHVLEDQAVSNRALVHAAELLEPGGSIGEQARALEAQIKRFEIKWPRLRSRAEGAGPPPGLNEIDRYLFAAFRARRGRIPKYRQLYSILAGAASCNPNPGSGCRGSAP